MNNHDKILNGATTGFKQRDIYLSVMKHILFLLDHQT